MSSVAQPSPVGQFKRSLGLYDSTMVVAGSMIGSGIFIVSAEMARLIGCPGWLLVAWLIAGLLTITGALSYGELAVLMPRAGGQYVYLREAYSPLCGFLYGWTLILVIQTGTIAAVAIGFARFFGILWPPISESNYIISPVHVSAGYAFSLSTAQLIGLALIAALTWTNTRGLEYGKIIQNIFTTAKLGTLFALIVLGVLLGWNSAAVEASLAHFWTPQGVTPVVPGLSAVTMFGLFAALCVSQTGSLFAADAWNNITFTAGEVKDPKRNVPLSLALGTAIVIGLFLLVNLVYIVVLPFDAIQHASADRVATAALETIFPRLGSTLMAAAIMISTFGCMNGLILTGARACFAMARDGLFFRGAAILNQARVPGWALVAQGIWAAFLVLPRTYDGTTRTYGNLYNNLLDYIISAALIFYILTIAAVFRLRATMPHAPRPYKAFGYPFLPALYIVGAAVILIMLLLYRPATTIPGVIIIVLGMPAYLLLRQRGTETAAQLVAQERTK